MIHLQRDVPNSIFLEFLLKQEISLTSIWKLEKQKIEEKGEDLHSSKMAKQEPVNTFRREGIIAIDYEITSSRSPNIHAHLHNYLISQGCHNLMTLPAYDKSEANTFYAIISRVHPRINQHLNDGRTYE